MAILTKALSATARLLAKNAIDALDVSTIPALDRFAIVHFVSVQRAFIKGIEAVLGSLEIAEVQPERKTPLDRIAKPRHRQEEVSRAIEIASGIDLPYMMTVNPSTQIAIYFKEYEEVLAGLLDSSKIVWNGPEPLKRCIEIAMHEYGAWVSGETEAARAVRSFLNYEQQQIHQNAILDNVNGLTTALKDWITVDNLAARRQEKWSAYRKVMAELPDDKVTIFDENFGVRKVFVQPTATYQVASIKREKPVQVSDVAGLLGTLISDRTQADDLILLCGGPGSGKSTLCRVLASELAENEQVHPIFLRLRRLQDTQDIVGFIEAHLQNEGLIDKFSDLSVVPNLVLILDGFDELVMASRSKLREFFNALRDDLSSGPLRNAKAIVSGRDTLFPNGAGLPMGAHVISLLPFDRPRIAKWGAKWRSLHSGKEAKSFFPENLIAEGKSCGRNLSPLEHLVSWPLTLHLIARAHTSGSIDLKPNKTELVEKAVLYRSIVADTALRQENQASGRGRLNPSQMRRFVQAIAWEMYSSGREALDVSEGLPILRKILPEATDADLAELADVTIVNQPELTKGEETGFEFVHKSFSEFFAAEGIAACIERACFQTEQWGTEDKTWGMSVHDATHSLGLLFAVRLLTVEVQEMLEPMLGDFKAFLENGNSVSNGPSIGVLRSNLELKLKRLEQLLIDFGGGGYLDVVAQIAKTNKPEINPLEGFGNYVSALLFLSVSLAGRIKRIDLESNRHVRIVAPALVRLIHLVLSADIQIDPSFSERGLVRIDATSDGGERVELMFPPIAPSLLQGVKGLAIPLSDAIARLNNGYATTQLENILLGLMLELNGSKFEGLRRHRSMHSDYSRYENRSPNDYLHRIVGSNSSIRDMDETRYFERRIFEIVERFRETGDINFSRQKLEVALYHIRDGLIDNHRGGPRFGEFEDRLRMILHDLSEPSGGPQRRPSVRKAKSDQP